MTIKQVSNLTYRHVDGLYYVTNPSTKEIVILNNPAFTILKSADNRSIDDLCRLLINDSNASSYERVFDRELIITFLEALKKLLLIEF